MRSESQARMGTVAGEGAQEGGHPQPNARNLLAWTSSYHDRPDSGRLEPLCVSAAIAAGNSARE